MGGGGAARLVVPRRLTPLSGPLRGTMSEVMKPTAMLLCKRWVKRGRTLGILQKNAW